MYVHLHGIQRSHVASNLDITLPDFVDLGCFGWPGPLEISKVPIRASQYVMSYQVL